MEFDNLLTLIKAVSDSELTEFQYEENGTTLRFVRETPKTELVLPMEPRRIRMYKAYRLFYHKTQKPGRRQKQQWTETGKFRKEN